MKPVTITGHMVGYHFDHMPEGEIHWGYGYGYGDGDGDSY